MGGSIEIHASLRQFEVGHDVAGMQRTVRRGPRDAGHRSARARRQVAGLLGAALLTCALLLGGTTVGAPADGAGDGTPTNVVLDMEPPGA